MTEYQGREQDAMYIEMLADFLDESSQLVDKLNESLLQLDEWTQAIDDAHDQACDIELLNSMFRSAHSLKGLSAMLGLSDINHLTHRLENVFDAAQRDELRIESHCVELMFRAVDHLTAMLQALENDQAEPVDSQPVIDDIGMLLSAAGCERQQGAQDAAEKILDECKSLSGEFSKTKNTRSSDNDTQHKGTTTTKNTPTEPPNLLEGVVDENEIPEIYLPIFIDESDMTLDHLSGILLGEQPTNDRVGVMLVDWHRIKGAAASVGLHRTAKLAHTVEDLLQIMAEGQCELSHDAEEVILACIDGLKVFIDGLREGKNESSHFDDLARGLSRVFLSQVQNQPNTQKKTKSVTDNTAFECRHDDGNNDSQAASEASRPPLPPKASISDTLRLYVTEQGYVHSSLLLGNIRFDANLVLSELKALLVCEKLAGSGELVYCDPPVDSLESLDEVRNLSFALLTDLSHEQIRHKATVAGVVDIVVEPALQKTDSPSNQTSSSSENTVEPPIGNMSTGSPPIGNQHDEQPPIANQPVDPQQLGSSSDSQRTKSPTKSKDTATRTPGGVTKAETGSETKNKPTETLRVDIERLDQLMNLAGQLVISKSQFARITDLLRGFGDCRQMLNAVREMTETLHQITATEQSGPDKKSDNSYSRSSFGRLSPGIASSGSQRQQSNDNRRSIARLQMEMEELRSQAASIEESLQQITRETLALQQVRGTLNELDEAVHQLDRIAGGIQKSVMDTRMVPIGPLFNRFNRVVRDVTRVNGKSIRLVIQGEKTELDKRMIDELSDPLIHMVRNSADHGIEDTIARTATGKPPEGTVTLNAYHRGNSVFIEVRDDGKGLDVDRIREKGLSRGLMTEADAAKMTHHQLCNLIWEPGFSTAAEVTEISGRGMGMDIVKSKIEDLSGSVDLESTKGQGTTIRMKLPLTMAILPCLMVRIGDHRFSIPTESVDEIVMVENHRIKTVHGKHIAEMRGKVTSLAELDELINWPQPLRSSDTPGVPPGPTYVQSDSPLEQTLVILKDHNSTQHGRELALLIDQVLGEDDVVIKSLADNYKNVTGISGACILGDGQVSLILDVGVLIDLAANHCAGMRL